MKKVPFIVLLIAEFIVALCLMGLLMANIGAVSYVIAVLIFAAVLTKSFIKLKKSETEEEKARLRRKILLLLLIPIGVIVVAAIGVIIALFLYFG